MRSALDWARVRALAADGFSQREIAGRLRINRRTVVRMLASDEPPRYRRALAGSQLGPLEPVLRRLLEEWPQIKAPRVSELLRAEYGYTGSVDVVRRRLRELRPRSVRPAQRTAYRPGQVLQLDWAEMPTRPRVASLPYSGAQTAFFSFDMTIESFLEGTRARSSGWRACRASAFTTAYVRSSPAASATRWSGIGASCSTLGELDGQYADWRDEVCNRRRHASGRE